MIQKAQVIFGILILLSVVLATSTSANAHGTNIDDITGSYSKKIETASNGYVFWNELKIETLPNDKKIKFSFRLDGEESTCGITGEAVQTFVNQFVYSKKENEGGLLVDCKIKISVMSDVIQIRELEPGSCAGLCPGPKGLDSDFDRHSRKLPQVSE